MIRLTNRFDMTVIALDWDVKPQNNNMLKYGKHTKNSSNVRHFCVNSADLNLKTAEYNVLIFIF